MRAVCGAYGRRQKFGRGFQVERRDYINCMPSAHIVSAAPLARSGKAQNDAAPRRGNTGIGMSRSSRELMTDALLGINTVEIKRCLSSRHREKACHRHE